MGTGTPAVVVSGISAADMILRKEGLEEYRYAKDKGFVRYLSEVKTAYPEKISIGSQIYASGVNRIIAEKLVLIL